MSLRTTSRLLRPIYLFILCLFACFIVVLNAGWHVVNSVPHQTVPSCWRMKVGFVDMPWDLLMPNPLL